MLGIANLRKMGILLARQTYWKYIPLRAAAHAEDRGIR